MNHLFRTSDSYEEQLLSVFDQRNRFIGFKVVSAKSHSKAPQPLSALEKAVIQIEDRMFFEGYGISFRSMTRALIKNFSAMKIVQGGSTISQQAVRLRFPLKNRWVRKATELLLAPALNLSRQKRDILHYYLTNVYWGNGVRGAKAASHLYFRKDPSQLDQIESITLASILSRPNYWSRHPAHLSQKVSKALGANSSKDAIAKAKLAAKNSYRQSTCKLSPAISRYLGNPNTRNGKVTLSIDSELEKGIEFAISRKHKLEYVSAAVLDYKKGSFSCAVSFRNGHRDHTPFLYQTRIRPGSTFKPFLLATFAKCGLEPEERILQSKPTCFQFQESANWAPKNYANIVRNKISLLSAVANSDNIACVQALQKVGLSRFRETLIDFGLLNEDDIVFPSSVLGSTKLGTIPFRLIRAYSLLAGLKSPQEDSCFLKTANPLKTDIDPGIIWVRKGLSAAVNFGTCQSLKTLGIIGAKTGTEGAAQTLLCFDERYLYYLHVRDEQLRYLEKMSAIEQAKTYTVMDVFSEIAIQTRKILKSTFSETSFFNERRRAS